MYENKEYWFECIAEARPSITELVYVFDKNSSILHDVCFSWKTNNTILQRMSPTLDGRYPLHLNVTRRMHNQHLSCSALNSAGISEDIVVLEINCMLFSCVFDRRNV